MRGTRYRRSATYVNHALLLDTHRKSGDTFTMPRKTEKQKKRVVMAFDASDGLRDRIENIAVDERRSCSFVIRELLLRALDAERKTA